MRRRPTRYYSKKQETKVARELNMKVQPNSGATPFYKGDVSDENVLLECKTLTKPQTQRTIKKEWLTKLVEEQFAMGLDFSGLVFDFGDTDEYVIITLDLFKELMRIYKEFHEEN